MNCKQKQFLINIVKLSPDIFILTDFRVKGKLMCIVIAKKFPGVGWLGAKNRDRNYIPLIRIVQSNRRGIQRLYIDDSLSRYTEGINEFGLCIINAALSVKSDEKELEKSAPANNKKYQKAGYMSTDGKRIRTALYEKTPEAAMKYLIKEELLGSTLIFNKDKCFLLEAGKIIDEETEEPGDYVYKTEEIKEYIVRTNHGILIPELGYSSTSQDPEVKKSRASSERRYKIVEERLKKLTDPTKLLEVISLKKDDDPFMNPIRFGDTTKKAMVTTGQLLLVPHERTLHYRPIHSDIDFRYTKLNRPDAKTFFEVISNRKLLGFKEFLKFH